MKLPTLYKKTFTGAIQFWDISVNYSRSSETGDDDLDCVATIVTKYGQLNTDSPQVTYDNIREGKNIGKKNATTRLQQAEAEAKAKHEKQRKKGYVESIEAAQADQLDDLIEGGVEPMLAHSFAKHGHKIKYPAYVQPKLDGIRCIAIVKNGKCTLWSRTRKPITSCPHIIEEIEKSAYRPDLVLDGELYNHNFKKNFEHIVHLVRQEDPDSKCTDVQYHIYDIINNESFYSREQIFTRLINDRLVKNSCKYIKIVPTTRIYSEDSVSNCFDKFKSKGYEGAILRNSEGLYVNKRSYDLQKVKEFDDAEFEITGVDEGRGKLAGHVGAFVCRTKDGKEFLAKMSGETTKLKEYFENHKLWKGKQLTVKFQGLTGANGVPRFPVGIAIRDYE